MIAVTYGSGDSDSFGYDPNTGRMTSYTFTVGGKTVNGALSWNTNGTLETLTITDQITSMNNQTCNYLYDDMARLNSVSCGTAWSQTFSYDPFGNISKSGSISFQPTYNLATNQYQTLPNTTPTYDANGNLTHDEFHNYAWDAEGELHQKDGTVTYTYDALGLRAEQVNGTSAVQSIYDPLGIKMVLATPGRVLWDARIPLVGGAMANYVQTALSTYWHPDWLGTGRLESTPSQTVLVDAAFAPFGEQYLPSVSFDDIWTGSAFQDTATDLWDFPAREYHPTQGRFVSPDPAGAAAVGPSNPQSWNRYAYVMNNPNSLIDPLGLQEGGTQQGLVFFNCGTGAFTITFYATNLAGAISLCSALKSALGPAYSSGPTSTGGGSSGASGQQGPCAEPNFLQRAGIAAQRIVARLTNSTIGFGVGGSAAAGNILGVALTVSRQVQVSPNGNAALVTSYTALVPSFFNAVVSPGAGAYGGLQVSASNATTPLDLVGTSVNYGVGGSPTAVGLGGGYDVSLGSGTKRQLILQQTLTGPFAAGAVGHGFQITTTYVTPFCGS